MSAYEHPVGRKPFATARVWVRSRSLPSRQMKLVQAWIELPRDELMADWILAAAGQTPYKIDP